jgi:hypothetical protein
MMSKTIASESLDFAAHASSAFLALTVAGLLGVWFTALGAIFLAFSFGFVREFTEWQNGGNHPFTRWGILDQLGWISGGIGYCLVLGR